jgi:hypothetical protein
MRSIEPGTRAVSMPAAPIRPTTGALKVSLEIWSSERSTLSPSRPGTRRTAAKPTKKTKSVPKPLPPTLHYSRSMSFPPRPDAEEDGEGQEGEDHDERDVHSASPSLLAGSTA